MAGSVTTAHIASVCLLIRTDSCCMAAIVKSPIYEIGTLGDGFCKECAGYFSASMTLYTNNGMSW